MADSTPLPVENPLAAPADDQPDATPEAVESINSASSEPDVSSTPQIPVTAEPEPVTAPYSAYADPNTVLVIPRVTLNYVVIAIVFFFLGAAIAGGAVS